MTAVMERVPMLPWASSHSDDTPSSTSSPTPPAANQSVRAHGLTLWPLHRQLDDISAASQTEKADLFSSLWNPAFIKRRAAPADVTASSGQTESDSQVSALCLLAAAAAICGSA